MGPAAGGGPVVEIDVPQIDFASNVPYLIAVHEGTETLLVPEEFRAWRLVSHAMRATTTARRRRHSGRAPSRK